MLFVIKMFLSSAVKAIISIEINFESLSIINYHKFNYNKLSIQFYWNFIILNFLTVNIKATSSRGAPSLILSCALIPSRIKSTDLVEIYCGSPVRGFCKRKRYRTNAKSNLQNPNILCKIWWWWWWW